LGGGNIFTASSYLNDFNYLVTFTLLSLLLSNVFCVCSTARREIQKVSRTVA